MTRRPTSTGRTTARPLATEPPLRGRRWRSWFVIVAAGLLLLGTAASLLSIILG